MSRTETGILTGSNKDLAEAVLLLQEGGVVAVPTETVYGLAADARNNRALDNLARVKRRPKDKPFSLMVPNIAAARRIAIFEDPAENLASAFWPGPLTLVLPVRSGSCLSESFLLENGCIGLRIPDHPVAARLLQMSNGPLAVSSANISGRPSTSSAMQVIAGLSGRISAVINAGPAPSGVESTIIGIMDTKAEVLRQGALAPEEVERILRV